jgi:hypothetical protein
MGRVGLKLDLIHGCSLLSKRSYSLTVGYFLIAIYYVIRKIAYLFFFRFSPGHEAIGL